MSRPSHLSPDNILRFLQLRTEPASANEIARGLQLKKTDTRPLFKMLAKLKNGGPSRSCRGVGTACPAAKKKQILRAWSGGQKLERPRSANRFPAATK